MSRLLRDPVPWLLAASLAVFFAAYALNSGLTSTNDGSHYALLASLHDRGTPELGPNLVFARHDAARFEGRSYSDRYPGVALLGTAFARAMRPALGWMRPLRQDPWARRFLVGSESFLAVVMLLPPLAAALLLPLLYALLRETGSEPAPAALLAASAIPGTLLLRYATVLYSHVFATALVTAAFAAWLRWGRTGRLGWLAAGSAALSWAVVVEYATVLLFLPAVAWGLAHPSVRGRRPEALAVFVAAGLPALAALLLYNQASFGDPFTIAHFHHSTVAEHRSLGSTFDPGNVPHHGWLLLFEARRFVSVFASGPQLLLALPGVVLAFRGGRRADHGLVLAGFAVAWLPTAAYAVEIGGYDRDYRQMLFGLPFLLVFVGRTLAWAATRSRAVHAGAWALYAAGWAWAVPMQLAHVRHAGQAELGSDWPNLGPALWNGLPLALLGSAFVLALWWRARRRETGA